MRHNDLNQDAPITHDNVLMALGLWCVLLLAPTVGGATVLAELVAEMEPGEWRVLNTNGDGSGFSEELLDARYLNILQYADKGLWDPNKDQFHFIGQGHGGIQKFITYDETTNTWREEPPPYWDCTRDKDCNWGGGIGHGYEHSALDPASGDIYARPFNSKSIYRYHKSKDSWSELPNLPYSPACCAALAYFPDMRGLLVVGGGYVLFLKEKGKKWREIAWELTMGPYHNIASYSPQHKVVLFGGGNDSKDLYKIDSRKKITKLKDAPVNIGIYATINTVDPVTGKFLVFTDDAVVYEYAVDNDSWNRVVLDGAPFGGEDSTEMMVAAPVPRRGVIMFVKYAGSRSRVYVYRHTAR